MVVNEPPDGLNVVLQLGDINYTVSSDSAALGQRYLCSKRCRSWRRRHNVRKKSKSGSEFELHWCTNERYLLRYFQRMS